MPIRAMRPCRGATLYHAADGLNWKRLDHWLTDAALSSWYGVNTNWEGQAMALNLGGKDLSGPIPRRRSATSQRSIICTSSATP